uniref:Uncharacterized protein n=1 Tax=Anguilla anguilla TaxID=7936 RepID=A0A0E9SSK4_ANGAN
MHNSSYKRTHSAQHLRPTILKYHPSTNSMLHIVE